MPSALNPFDKQDLRTLIDERAITRANHPFMIWDPIEGASETWTYLQFRQAVSEFAAGLQARGIEPGQRILVHLDNCPESIIAWLGCAYVGAVAVTTNARSSADEIAYFANHSKASAAITQPKFADLVHQNALGLGWIAVTATDNGAFAVIPEHHLSLGSIKADPASIRTRPHDPMAPFAIQYTSGTTARPKAVLWTHGNGLWGARSAATNEDLRAEDVHLVYLPLFHTNAQVYSVLATFWAGGTVVLMPKFSASRFWPISLKYQCTWTSMVPFCLRALMEQPKPQKHFYRLWGNAVCEPPTDSYFGVKTIGWWGMTETITHGTVGSVHSKNAPMSMGRSAPGYGIHILDDQGNPVAPGEVGDLFIEGIPGLSLFLEYAFDPIATAKAFRPDGLFITGDRVRRGSDGFLYFADRSKDMLKVGGENVAASEIESVIAGVPGVKEVAIAAMKHPMLDEVPVAFIIPAEGHEPDILEKAAAACKQALAGFKQPHEFRLVDSLPRATLEKVSKAALRAILNGEGDGNP